MKHPRYPRKVYAIKHNVTGKVYVGSSSNIEQRIKSHLACLRNHKHSVEDMQADFDRYGEDFTVSIIDDIYNMDENEKEYDWMRKYESYIREKGYNYKDRLNPKKQSIKRNRENNKTNMTDERELEFVIFDESKYISFEDYNSFCKEKYGLFGLGYVMRFHLTKLAIKMLTITEDTFGKSTVKCLHTPWVQPEERDMTRDEIAYCNDFLKELYPVIAKYAKIAIERNKK